MKQEYFDVYISPSKGSKEISDWQSKIKENYGPLSGYASDLNEKGINSVLLSILQLNNNINYLNIRGIYLEHIKSLQNLDSENSKLKEEIETLEQNSPSSKVVDILLKYGILTGIILFIPYDKIYKEYKDIMGENVFQGNKPPINKPWEDLTVDINYVPKEKVPFVYSDLKLAVEVFIYSKAKFKLYNVTNFLSSVETSVVRESGGKFVLQMQLISPNNLDLENKDNLKNRNNFQDNNINVKGYRRAQLLQSVFRENDLVFIRYENLKIEEEIKGKNIKGKCWDLMGLIDTTTIVSTFNSINITISGRDFIKLLTDDNNFFIPYQFANSPETIFGGRGTKVFKRLFTTGEYNLEFVKSFKSIENSIGFILSQLTNIQVLSSSCIKFLKDEYGEDLSKNYEFVYDDKDKKEKKEVINGIWGLVNYYVDEKITHYRLADASLKAPNGSIMQQLLKICQEPFVEVIADTYFDKETKLSKYSIIARRPPFSIEDISKQNFIVISRDSSISDSLNFCTDIFTVFQLDPQGGCFANDNSIILSYLPMIVLDEYTKLWGSKLYSQVYNYINIDAYNQIDGNIAFGNGQRNKTIKETFIDDLVWLVESNAYIPFSRMGTITIKGDRRIKVGQWIYYEKSNEIFYVDGVTHSVSIANGNIDRKTVLNVSRGLVKDYVVPSTKKFSSLGGVQNISNVSTSDFHNVKKVTSFSNVSYGGLIDIDYLREGLRELFIKINKNFSLHKEIKQGDTFKAVSSIVVPEVFNFFLSGAQFEGKVIPYSLYYGFDNQNPALSLKSINTITNINKNRGRNVSINVDYVENSIPDGLSDFSNDNIPGGGNNNGNRGIEGQKGYMKQISPAESPGGEKWIFIPEQ